jgi:hypothetical protein
MSMQAFMNPQWSIVAGNDLLLTGMEFLSPKWSDEDLADPYLKIIFFFKINYFFRI